MWSVRKNIIITIITCVSLGLFTIFCMIIIPAIISIIKENKTTNELNKYFSNYNQKDNVAYYEDQYLYYQRNKFEYFENSYFLYLNDSCIFIEDDKNDKYKLLSFDGQIKSIDYDSLNINLAYVFVRNNYIYYKDSSEFYRYDLLSCEKEKISDEYYIYAYNDELYSVNKTKKEITISDNSSEKNISITKSMIVNDKNLSDIPSINMFQFNNYQIIGDIIYIQLYYEYFDIIVSFNMNNKELELYDWIKHERYNDPLKFFVFENDSMHILNKYFIL